MIKVIAADADGAVRWRARQPTTAAPGPENLVTQVAELVTALRGRASGTGAVEPRSIGVVVPGIVDQPTGVARFAVNLNWKDLPLRDLLEDRLDLPVVLGHDVRAGGLAEGQLGAARGADDVLFVALGTGVAGAITLGGTMWPGSSSLAGELGHIVVERDGHQCGCGGRGCLETISGASAIVRRYRKQAGRDLSEAAEVFRRAASGDQAARQVCQDAVAALATVLAGVQGTLDLELVVIGGGLAGAGRRLLEPVRSALSSRLTFQSMPKLALAELGSEAGCLGAALLGRSAVP
jgi:glucokinase